MLLSIGKVSNYLTYLPYVTTVDSSLLRYFTAAAVVVSRQSTKHHRMTAMLCLGYATKYVPSKTAARHARCYTKMCHPALTCPSSVVSYARYIDSIRSRLEKEKRLWHSRMIDRRTKVYSILATNARYGLR